MMRVRGSPLPLPFYIPQGLRMVRVRGFPLPLPFYNPQGLRPTFISRLDGRTTLTPFVPFILKLTSFEVVSYTYFLILLMSAAAKV